MSKPRKTTNFTNSRSARDFLRETYGRYALGTDRYPNFRIKTPLEELPVKVHRIAKILTGAWRVIDQDNAFFADMVRRTAISLDKREKKDTAGLVLAKSGLNAVNLGVVSIEEGRPHSTLGNFTPPEAVDLVNNHLRFAPGVTPVRINDAGVVEIPPQPDAIVFRPRPDGVSLLYGDAKMLDGLIPIVGRVQ